MRARREERNAAVRAYNAKLERKRRAACKKAGVPASLAGLLHGFTYVDVSRACGMSYQRVVDVFAGRTRCRLDEGVKLAVFLGITAERLQRMLSRRIERQRGPQAPGVFPSPLVPSVPTWPNPAQELQDPPAPGRHVCSPSRCASPCWRAEYET